MDKLRYTDEWMNRYRYTGQFKAGILMNGWMSGWRGCVYSQRVSPAIYPRSTLIPLARFIPGNIAFKQYWDTLKKVKKRNGHVSGVFQHCRVVFEKVEFYFRVSLFILIILQQKIKKSRQLNFFKLFTSASLLGGFNKGYMALQEFISTVYTKHTKKT